MKPYLEKLIARHDLTSAETSAAFSVILSGADPVQVGAFLMLLRSKGETSVELSGMVQAMSQACRPVVVAGPPGAPLLDIVGTGGDGADTVNISTMSAVLAAACGCKVAKVGNRSVSSSCGSADVLEALGIKVDLEPRRVAECVERCGIGFMFAPVHHPAMANVAPVRKALGIRSCFNILGPMTNPAGANRAVVGAFEEEVARKMAGAIVEVGKVEHAVVIHGCGLDEISPIGKATIHEIRNVAKEGMPKR